MYSNSVTEWLHKKPPMVVFILTLLACALTLVAISIYVETHKHNLANPNVKDWNSFFNSLSKLEVCIPSAANDSVHQDFMQGNVSSYTGLVGISLESIDGEQSPLATLLGTHSVELLVTEYMVTNRVAMMGHKADELLLTISMPASGEKNPQMAKRVKKEDEHQQSGAAGGHLEACVSFVGAAHLLPSAQEKPGSCTQKEAPVVRAVVSGEAEGICPPPVYGLHLHQPMHLTPLLSQEETVLIQLHIVYTTCALVTLVVLLLACAVCGRRARAADRYAADRQLLVEGKTANGV